MPCRKHFAWPSGRKSFSLRQTMVFSRSKLFTKIFDNAGMGVRCGYLAAAFKKRHPSPVIRLTIAGQCNRELTLPHFPRMAKPACGFGLRLLNPCPDEPALLRRQFADR